jgi:asparagine N-glycosylation enzyme membrane subunit Stt3
LHEERVKGEKMKRLWLTVLIGAFLFVGCAVRTGYRGEAVIVPALPSIVVLESDPYYYHSGYHYHYQNDRWFYSSARSGPWVELPRDRYPKETRFKGKGHGQGRGDERGRGEKRGHDERRD